jgi:hypothetical protein
VRLADRHVLITVRLDSEAIQRAIQPAAASPPEDNHVARFWRDWTRHCLPLPVGTVRTESLHQAYALWCSLQRVSDPALVNVAVVLWGSSPGVRKARRQHLRGGAEVSIGQSNVITPAGVPEAVGRAELGRDIERFDAALAAWRKRVGPPVADRTSDRQTPRDRAGRG